MTEKSYFWDGIIAGDSTLAPYNAEEFNTWIFSAFLANNFTEGYIIPGYLNDLTVKTAGVSAHSIVIDTGAACFNNCLYILDTAKSIPITRATSSYYRRDIVVLRINFITQTARVAVVEGGSSLSPAGAAVPLPTQTAGIWEIVLATVLVDGLLTYVKDGFVYDTRKFIYNVFARLGYTGGSSNLVRNSEWMAYGRDVTAVDPPDEWVMIVNGTNLPRVATTDGSGRGNWGVNLDSGSYGQWIIAHGNTFTLKVFVDNTDPANSQNVLLGLQAYRSNGDLSSVSKEAHIYYGITDVEITFTVTFPEDDIEKLFLYLTFDESFVTPVSYVSQIVLMPGYHAGGYHAVSEILMIKDAITDASWTATAKSTGITTINFTASFGTLIKNYTRAVILRLRGRDSGSAAALNCYLRARGYAAPYDAVYGSLEIAGVTNDVWREINAIVPVDQIYFGTGTAGARLRLEVLASGAGTFDATVEVVGIII